MKIWIQIFCLYWGLLLPVHGVYAKDSSVAVKDPVVEARLINIAKDMRCLVCQNESLVGSQADLAVDLRKELRNLIRQGKSDNDIRNYMVARYGEFVLYRPSLKPKNWLLWLGPFLMLLVGIGIMLKLIRKISRPPPAISASPYLNEEQAKGTEHLSEQEQLRLKKLLQEGHDD